MEKCRNHKVWLVLWLTTAQAFVIHAAVPALTLQRVAIFPYAVSVSVSVAGQPSTVWPDGDADAEPGPGPALLLRDASDPADPAEEGGRRPPDRCRRFFSAYKATLPRGPLGLNVAGCPDAGASFTVVRPARIRPAEVRGSGPSGAFISLTIGLCRPRC